MQIAIGEAFTGALTVELMLPCNTGDKMTVSGTLKMKLGDWLDQQFSAAGVFMCGDIEKGETAIDISVTMPKLVIQNIEITKIEASVKLIMGADGGLDPVVVFSGSMEVLKSTGQASVSYGNDALALDTDVSLVLPLSDKISATLRVKLHASFPIAELGDLSGTGSIEVPGIDLWGLDNFNLKGEVTLDLGLGGDFRVVASLAVQSGQKLKLFGIIEFTLPAKIQVTASKIEGVFMFEVAVIIKDRYKFAARVDAAGTWSISGEAFNIGMGGQPHSLVTSSLVMFSHLNLLMQRVLMLSGKVVESCEALIAGPLQFLEDLLSLNPWAWHDELEQDMPNNFIVKAIGGMKKLTNELLVCEKLTIMYQNGGGEQMFIAAATGCNLLLVKISFTVIVLDWQGRGFITHHSRTAGGHGESLVPPHTR